MLLSALPVTFYQSSTLQVARNLLGMRLVRRLNGQRISGIISETEAYCGEKDLACHARAGRTPRTLLMYGPAGMAYIYFTYGMHWMLNVVTEAEGNPSAVLIRAIRPLEGLEIIAARRPSAAAAHRTDGPAKLCRALDIDRRLNGCNLCDSDGELWIEPGEQVSDSVVQASPRVGISNVPEPWKSKPWRFFMV